VRRRFGPGYLMAAFLIVSACALIILFLSNGRPPRHPIVEHERIFIGAGMFIWALLFYRLLIEVCSWGPRPESSIAAWQPLETANRQFRSLKPARGGAPVFFLISPWPWVKLLGSSVVLPMLGVNLLISLLAPLPWLQLPALEQYAIALSTIPISALFGGFFLMHHRLLHFGIGSRACAFRIAPPKSDMRSMVCHYRGSFPLSLIAGIWVREKLSSFLRWKELHYGITFNDGDEMQLGVTTRHASWTGVSDLKWELVLDELSARTGVPIYRHINESQSREFSLVRP
jgi:hypothetical protein